MIKFETEPKKDLIKVINVQGQALKKLHVIIKTKNQEIIELNKTTEDYKVTLKRVKRKMLKESRKTNE